VTDDRDPYRPDAAPQPYPYLSGPGGPDPDGNDDARQPRNPYDSPPSPYVSGGDAGPSPYSAPTGTPPGPYLSDWDSAGADRTAGPRSDDRDPLLVRLWRRFTGSR
jgi:hypothetical protein